MAERLYNGVSLPALPEWDKGAFPYAYIAQNIGVTAYILTVAAERPVYGPDPEDGSVGSVYHYGRSASYLVHEGAWLLMVEAEELVHVREDVGKVIWTNTDILRPDGSVYLAAESSGADSFLAGLALGLCGKPLPFVQKEPVAYLYNGVRLPALPEWDKTTYPYALLRHFHGGNASTYWLELFSVAPAFYADSYGIIAFRYVSQAKIQYKLADGEWVHNWTGTTSGGSYSLEDNAIIWTNFDIKNTDSGSVYYPKSPDPVPVYE